MKQNKDIVANPFGAAMPAEASSASAVALQQREVAEVQSAMVIAKRFPRDPQKAMDKILMACTRVSLAEKAEYQYARGGTDISGPSIRLAEECARGWGNILAGVAELSRGNGVSECLAYAWDLESGYRDEKRFQVKHWRDTKSGGYALKDERDIYELVANQGSRRKRACILSVIPGDVVEAAQNQCAVTLKTKVELTPERINGMVEKFAAHGVTRELIEKRIQRRLDALTPALFVQLGKIYTSLSDGMSSAGDWFDLPKEKSGNGSTTLSELTNGNKQPDAKPEQQPEQTTPATEGITVADVHRHIVEAKNEDQLTEAMDLIRELPENERDALKKLALQRSRDL